MYAIYARDLCERPLNDETITTLRPLSHSSSAFTGRAVGFGRVRTSLNDAGELAPDRGGEHGLSAGNVGGVLGRRRATGGVDAAVGKVKLLQIRGKPDDGGVGTPRSRGRGGGSFRWSFDLTVVLRQ